MMMKEEMDMDQTGTVTGPLRGEGGLPVLIVERGVALIMVVGVLALTRERGVVLTMAVVGARWRIGGREPALNMAVDLA